MSKKPADPKAISRRNFIKAGGVAAGAVAGASALGLDGRPARAGEEEAKPKPGIRQFRLLGRTGFKVSDISLGGDNRDPNVVRYAYDRGVNFVDTAEGYGNGESETIIGKAMKFIDRKQFFIVTKLKIKPEEKEQGIRDRFAKCLQRLQTDYVDALYTHSVGTVKEVKHKSFHAVAEKLKADGKIRHVGISNHGPRDKTQDSMEKVLLAAVEDGRFDLMLLSYNFMNQEEGQQVLKACREKNIGTTCMKAAPGVIKVDPFDPKNPAKEYAEALERMKARGMKRKEAEERIRKWISRQEENIPKTKPFLKKYGIKAEDELKKKSIQWVLDNPDMHTVCVGMAEFDAVDKFVPLSGTHLSSADREYLNDFRLAYGSQYCRHGCSECLSACPNGLPVSTIMRYAYYFKMQGREKLAMQKYANLAGRDASRCLDCDAPCRNACPHGVAITANLMAAHNLLAMV